jgi:hypothetical protein
MQFGRVGLAATEAAAVRAPGRTRKGALVIVVPGVLGQPPDVLDADGGCDPVDGFDDATPDERHQDGLDLYAGPIGEVRDLARGESRRCDPGNNLVGEPPPLVVSEQRHQ